MAQHTIYNERVKLSAAYLNGLGVGVFALGGLGPWLTVLYGDNEPGLSINAVSIICLCASIALHLYARVHLGNLRT